MLKNMREVQGHVTVHCNAGNITVNMIGHLPGFGPVWYYSDAIANTLSMFLVAQRFHIQYDSRTSGSFDVWKDDGTCRNFASGPKGLYYSDFKDRQETILVVNDQPKVVRTVEDNLDHFIRRQISDATTARRFQDTSGLITKALLRMIDSHYLINSPITREATKIATDLWGPSVANLKGKTTRANSDIVKPGVHVITPLPPQVLEFHDIVTLCIDAMKVNGSPFLVSHNRVIKFGTTTEFTNMKASSIVSGIILILRIYATRGFRVEFIAADNGFASLQQDEEFLSLQVTMDITSEDEHEPFSERFIQTIKGKSRMCLSLVPFIRLPRRMTIEMVYTQTFWYNFTIPQEYLHYYGASRNSHWAHPRLQQDLWARFNVWIICSDS